MLCSLMKVAEGSMIAFDYAITVFWNFWQVVFNLIMFRPFPGEIISAKVISLDADGLRCMYSIISWFLDCNYLLASVVLLHI
jgi:DNA-directed RNA polymerase subunit E'/Rpb7